MDAPTHFTARALLLIAVLLPLATGACDIPLDVTEVELEEPVATTVVLGIGDDATVLAGSTLNLNAAVLDQFGAVMAGETVAYATSDSTTATVDASGMLTGVAGGEVAVTATCGHLTTAVLVTVRYHVLPGEARARVRGTDVDYERSWDSDAGYYDYMMGSEYDLNVARFTNQAWADTGVVVWFPEAPGVGTHSIAATDVVEFLEMRTNADIPPTGAYFVAEGDEDVLYMSVGGTLELEAVNVAPRPFDTGTLEGHLTLRAAGYRVEFNDFWGDDYTVSPTGDTLTFFLDFAGDYQHLLLGQASFTIHASSTVQVPFADTYWDGYHYADSGYEVDFIAAAPGEAVYLSLLNPAEGSQALNAYSYASAPPTLQSYGSIGVGAATGGTVEITSLRHATDTEYGEAHGTVQADLAFTTDGWSATVVDTGTLTMEFHTPILPTSLSHAAPAEEESDGVNLPLWRGLVPAGRPRAPHR